MEMLSLEKELKENSYPGSLFHHGQKREQQKQSICRGW